MNSFLKEQSLKIEEKQFFNLRSLFSLSQKCTKALSRLKKEVPKVGFLFVLVELHKCNYIRVE